MFISYLATSASAISQLKAVFTAHFSGNYSIYELYNLWYVTSTVNDPTVSIRAYYRVYDNVNSVILGYYNNRMLYDTTTGLYSYGCPVGVPCGGPATATSNGFSLEVLATLTLYYPYTSDICFPEGTPITTNQGIIPIEKINTDFHTINNKKIVAISKSITHEKYLVCFEKNSLGQNIPSEKTVMTKDHKIFYNNKFIEAKYFLNKYKNVYSINYNGQILYNVLMEDYSKIFINNLPCETLHPENKIAKLTVILNNLNEEEYQKLLKKSNEKQIKNNVNIFKKKYA